MAAVVELSVVLTSPALDRDLEDAWEADIAILCPAWILALLAHPSVTSSTAVKPNASEKGKQLCPIISKINASEAPASVPKAVVRGAIYSSPGLPAGTRVVSLTGRPRTAKPFLLCETPAGAFLQVFPAAGGRDEQRAGGAGRDERQK